MLDTVQSPRGDLKITGQEGVKITDAELSIVGLSECIKTSYLCAPTVRTTVSTGPEFWGTVKFCGVSQCQEPSTVRVHAQIRLKLSDLCRL